MRWPILAVVFVLHSLCDHSPHKHEEAPYVKATWHAFLMIRTKPNTPSDDQNDGFRYCSGVIVNPRIILTSGHCLSDAYNTKWMVFYDFDGDMPYTDGKKGYAIQIRVYDLYKSTPTPETDYGIVYLSDPIQFTATVTKADLSSVNARSLTSDLWSKCQLSGSGQTVKENTCAHSFKKLYMSGSLVNRTDCESMIGSEGGAPFTTDSLCFRNLAATACHGDSGAGISCVNTIGQQKIVALHQGGRKCCDADGKVLISPRERRITPINAAFNTWLSQRIAEFEATFPLKSA